MEILFCRLVLSCILTSRSQNSISIDDFYNGPNQFVRDCWDEDVKEIVELVKEHFKDQRKIGVAKEVARVLLPEGLTMSTLYANGTLRSWMHYLEIREGNGTQKEHIQLANKIREVLLPVFPVVLGIKV